MSQGKAVSVSLYSLQCQLVTPGGQTPYSQTFGRRPSVFDGADQSQNTLLDKKGGTIDEAGLQQSICGDRSDGLR